MTPHPPAGPGEGVSAHGAASLKRVSASVLTLIVILAVSLAGGCSTAKPGKIVSLSPSATEILFQIGAGDEVVGVDEHSTYPPEVRSRRSGVSRPAFPQLQYGRAHWMTRVALLLKLRTDFTREMMPALYLGPQSGTSLRDR